MFIVSENFLFYHLIRILLSNKLIVLVYFFWVFF